MMAAASKFGEVGKGWLAYGVQLTYNNTRLEEEYLKGNAWRIMKNRTLTFFEVNPARRALTRGNSLIFRLVLWVIRPYLTIHHCKRKHKPPVRYKIVQFARLQATNENTRDGKRTNIKELPRPHKLLQGALATTIKDRVEIGKICLPLVGPPCIYKIFKEGQPP